MNRKRRLALLRVLSICCLVALLVGCGQPVPPTKVTPSGGTTIPVKVPIENIAYNRFIIMGPQHLIDQVIASYNIENDPIETIDLSFLTDMGPIDVERPPEFSDDKKRAVSRYSREDYSQATVVLRLYQNPSEDITTLPNLVDDLNSFDERVIADIDFKIVGLDSGTCGDPHSGGGSPFSHSSWEVTATDFEQQWALAVIDAFPESNDSVTAEPVKLAFFDTAPFSDFDGSQTRALPDGTNVTVTDSIREYSGNELTFTGTDQSLSDHGWEVVSLSAALASKGSEFLLYRVLDEYNCGALFTLLAAMVDFLRLMSDNPTDQPMCVLNASLGVSIPDGVNYEVEGYEDLALEIPSLATIVYEVYRTGCMFVAAAGNDSAPKSIEEPLEPQAKQFPSIYDTVISVAASTNHGNRSCFSNEGDIAAPGGNGGSDPQDLNRPCAPRTGNPFEPSVSESPPCDVSNMKDCHFGVIGVATASPDGYKLVSGTSFAAPWVTGLVARALEKVDGNRRLVYCMLQNGAGAEFSDASLGVGIIDVSRTLSDDTIAACRDQLGP